MNLKWIYQSSQWVWRSWNQNRNAREYWNPLDLIDYAKVLKGETADHETQIITLNNLELSIDLIDRIAALDRKNSWSWN